MVMYIQCNSVVCLHNHYHHGYATTHLLQYCGGIKYFVLLTIPWLS